MSTLREHLRELKALKDNRSFILRTKYDELQYHPEIRSLSTQRMLERAWIPTDLTNLELTVAELRALAPRLIHVPRTYRADWLTWDRLRRFCTRAPFDMTPGRMLRFFVVDDVTGGILGFASLAGDHINLPGRDQVLGPPRQGHRRGNHPPFIGWTVNERRRRNGRLQNIASMNTCVPTQPFGRHFLGGKLIALLMLGDLPRRCWEEAYGDRLVSLTTTSLNLNPSSDDVKVLNQYDNLPRWSTCCRTWTYLGDTHGRIYIKPDRAIYNAAHARVKEQSRYRAIVEAHNESGPPTGIKQKILDLILTEDGIPRDEARHGHPRGVYGVHLYRNAREFLRREIREADLVPYPEPDFLGWWRGQAEQQYRRLHATGKLKPERFVLDLFGLPWAEVVERYL